MYYYFFLFLRNQWHILNYVKKKKKTLSLSCNSFVEWGKKMRYVWICIKIRMGNGELLMASVLDFTEVDMCKVNLVM